MPPLGGCWACGIFSRLVVSPLANVFPFWGYQGLAAMPPGLSTPGQNWRSMGVVTALGNSPDSAAGGANHPNAAICDSQRRSGICGQGKTGNPAAIGIKRSIGEAHKVTSWAQLAPRARYLPSDFIGIYGVPGKLPGARASFLPSDNNRETAIRLCREICHKLPYQYQHAHPIIARVHINDQTADTRVSGSLIVCYVSICSKIKTRLSFLTCFGVHAALFIMRFRDNIMQYF